MLILCSLEKTTQFFNFKYSLFYRNKKIYKNLVFLLYLNEHIENPNSMKKKINGRLKIMTSNEKSNSVIKVFDSIATKYVEYFGDDWEFVDEIKKFTSQLKKGSTVLDLGCGSGYITNYLSSLNMNAIGIDFSKEMIKIAKKNYPKLQFLLADFVDIENHFKENSVNGLIAIYSLYFIPREQFCDMLNSLSKILKNDGLFLFVTQIGKKEDFVTTPLMEENGLNDRLYVNYYIQEELENILKQNNFSIENIMIKSDCDEKEISDSGRYIVLAKNKKR